MLCKLECTGNILFLLSDYRDASWIDGADAVLIGSCKKDHYTILAVTTRMGNRMSTTQYEGIVLYTDGAARPNPGKTGWGAHGYRYTTHYDGSKVLSGRYVTTESGYIATDKLTQVHKPVKTLRGTTISMVPMSTVSLIMPLRSMHYFTPSLISTSIMSATSKSIPTASTYAVA
jgi:hypothetical protein